MITETGTINRVSSGIPDLDTLIDGGYPMNRTILITGGPGVGKTILAQQFAHNICKHGQKCLYLATEETPEDFIIQAQMLGIPMAEYVERGLIEIVPALSERMDDIEWQRNKSGVSHLFKRPLAAIKASDASFVVIDNIGSYTFDTTVGSFREQMDFLVNTMREKSITGMIICDDTLNDRFNNVAQYSVYGVIHMFKRESPFTGNVERLMNVVKMRGTGTPLSYIRYTISKNGVNVQVPK
ncbi:MAG TPA: recombinase [Prolixibacteraceae bacterium]|nr:recombinase [Prolixibacteraceae bacterium]